MTLDTLLDWQQKPQVMTDNKPQGLIFSASSQVETTTKFQQAVLTTVDKAISMLEQSVRNESRYFLCEWSQANQALTIVVTDDDKQNDSPYITTCQMLDLKVNPDNTDDVKYWIQNHLTTHSGFSQFSLVAVFQHDSRSNTVLM